MLLSETCLRASNQPQTIPCGGSNKQEDLVVLVQSIGAGLACSGHRRSTTTVSGLPCLQTNVEYSFTYCTTSTRKDQQPVARAAILCAPARAVPPSCQTLCPSVPYVPLRACPPAPTLPSGRGHCLPSSHDPASATPHTLTHIPAAGPSPSRRHSPPGPVPVGAR